MYVSLCFLMGHSLPRDYYLLIICFLFLFVILGEYISAAMLPSFGPSWTSSLRHSSRTYHGRYADNDFPAEAAAW